MDSPVAGALLGGAALTTNHHLTENQVQVGFSYKFDTWAPSRSSRNIKPLAPASMQIKPGREAGSYCVTVLWRPIRGIPATVTGITPHTSQ